MEIQEEIESQNSGIENKVIEGFNLGERGKEFYEKEARAKIRLYMKTYMVMINDGAKEEEKELLLDFIGRKLRYYEKIKNYNMNDLRGRYNGFESKLVEEY